MNETLWTCDKCGAVMTTGSLAEHERWHKERDAADIEATRILPPSIPPEAPLLDRLAALSTWLGEFPFQAACVTGERTINDAINRIEELDGEAETTCRECGVYPPDHKGVCEGCLAYREHQA